MSPELLMVLSGLGGGLAAEFLRWYKLRTSTELPNYLHSGMYWALTIGMILIGGVVALLYSAYADLSSPLAAAQLGASTPAMLGAMAQGNNPEAGEMTARGGGLDLDEDEPETPPKSGRLRNFLAYHG